MKVQDEYTMHRHIYGNIIKWRGKRIVKSGLLLLGGPGLLSSLGDLTTLAGSLLDTLLHQ